jgi:hypothetical protein
MTIEATGNLSAVQKNKQKQARTLAEHDEQLREKLREACEEAGLADGITSEIVENGVYRFLIGPDGEIRPQSVFADIESYISHCSGSAPKTRRQLSQAKADERIVLKQQIYDEMVFAASNQNQREYNRLRQIWASM